MRDENVLLMRDHIVKEFPTEENFRISYHCLYITVIFALSVTLSLLLFRNDLKQNVLIYYDRYQNFTIRENQDYTFDSIKEFSKDHYNDSILKRKIDANSKFFNSNIKLAKPLKYILLWTSEKTKPMSYFKEGRIDFFNYGCELNNCFLTHNQKQLSSLANYDAILFHNQEFTSASNSKITWDDKNPRDGKQVYAMFETEPSTLYPICDTRWDSFFNWTWTYKQDSDLVWNFFNVRDKNAKGFGVVAPNINVIWNDTPGNLTINVENILKKKTKSVAWFISDKNKELDSVVSYVNDLMNETKTLGINIDIYNNTCPQDDPSICLEYLKNDYKFYLSFERTETSDYVTENFGKAMINYAVPIVFSRQSDYKRFAPTNSYIDASKHTAAEVATIIKNSMDDYEKYKAFHMWRVHYVYHFSYDHHTTHPLCKLCKALNNPEMLKPKIKTNLRKWWNGQDDQKLCP